MLADPTSDDRLDRAFVALGDPVRRRIVARLSRGPATVGDLAAPFEISLQAVSKHIQVLEEAGLVSRSRDAQRRPVHLDAEVFDLMTKWIERYRQQAEERYQQLDALLDRLQGRAGEGTDNDETEHKGAAG